MRGVIVYYQLINCARMSPNYFMRRQQKPQVLSCPSHVPETMTRPTRCSDLAGRCTFLLLLAILADAAGVVLLALGTFSNLSFWDFLIYSGAAVLALSLVFWVFWYTLNLEVSYEELGITSS